MEIDLEQVQFLREMHFSWPQVAAILGISHSTLYGRRVEAGIVDELRYSVITDEELKVAVEAIKEEFPDVGE